MSDHYNDNLGHDIDDDSDYDGFVKCPYCRHRARGSKRSIDTTFHKRKCSACKKQFVISEAVTRHIQTAEPPPMKVGDKFKVTGTLANGSVLVARYILLTRSQGWWVNGTGEHSDNERASVACEDTEPK